MFPEFVDCCFKYKTLELVFEVIVAALPTDAVPSTVKSLYTLTSGD